MCYNYHPEEPDDEGRIHMRQIQQKMARQRKSPYFSKGFDHEHLPVITQDDPDIVQLYSWGLVPFFAKDAAAAAQLSNNCLNARADTVYEKPSFKDSIKHRRCLVPASGLIEYRHVGKNTYPYYVQVLSDDFPDDKRNFCFAGIYSQWTDKATGEVRDTFSILTTEANQLMEFIHNSKQRMPVILNAADEARYLSPALPFDELDAMLQPYDANKMVAYSISKKFNSRDFDPADTDILVNYPYDLPEVPSIVSVKGTDLLCC